MHPPPPHPAGLVSRPGPQPRLAFRPGPLPTVRDHGTRPPQENMNEALCEQKVVRKAKLTKIAFNTKGADSPVILVGDDHSCVSSLKLSPNLRWTAVTKAEADVKAKAEADAAGAGGAGPRRGAVIPKPVRK